MNVLRRYNATQVATGLLLGGQARGLHTCRTLLNSKPPTPSNGQKDVEEKLRRLQNTLRNRMRNNQALQNAKSNVDNAWRTLDLKLAEFGFTPGGLSDADGNLIRYLVSLMLVLYLVYFLGPPSVKSFFMQHLVLTNHNGGRLYTMLTSLLIHTEVLNLLFSCLIIYSMSPALLGMLGRKRFWQLGVGSGVASNLYFSLKEHNSYTSWMPSLSYQCGMSSVCSALIVTSCLLTPNQTVQFFFFPVKALHIAYLVGGYDALRFALSLSGARADQVGGGMFGVAFWYSVLGQRTL